MDEMNYRVYARYTVSGDGGFTAASTYGGTATVSAKAYAPYKDMTTVFAGAGAGAVVDDDVSARIGVSACGVSARTEVNVWADTDQDDPVWITGTF